MEAVASSVSARTGEWRRRTANVLLVLFLVAVLAAAGWGLSGSLATESPPARLGEAVEVPGGLMSVDRAYPWHMAPMRIRQIRQRRDEHVGAHQHGHAP